MIKEYFANYWLHSADIKVNLLNEKTQVLRRKLILGM